MASEPQLKNNPLHKEFQNLLDKDFKDRKLKENEIIKATVTEITKNFIVVDCKAKMEGMIPIEEFKNDDELSKLKVGSQIDVYLERIESFKGEIIISRDKARKMKAWKKMEKVFETQEEMTGYITGKVKGGFIATVEGLPCFMPSSQIDVRPLKRIDHLMNTPVKVIATRIDKNRGNVCVSRRAVLEKSKKEAKKKQKTIEIKEIKIRPGINKHDYEVKVKAFQKFIKGGNKVKVSMRFRGREMEHQNLGVDLLKRLIEQVKEYAKVEVPPKNEGKQIMMVLVPFNEK